MCKLTKTQLNKALAITAAYLGPQMGYDGPAPTGQEAASQARGPQLVPDWDWTGKPTPTILLEGGPYDWTVEILDDTHAAAQFRAAGIFPEPYSSYALSLYPLED